MSVFRENTDQDLEECLNILCDCIEAVKHSLQKERSFFDARLAKLTRERDEARRQAAALIEGLQSVSDALARLDQIYREDIDLGDPPVEAPAWLREAQHRAAALLGSITSTPAPEAVEEMEAATRERDEARGEIAKAKEEMQHLKQQRTP